MVRKMVAAAAAFSFMFASCVTPNQVALSSPVPGTEFIQVDATGKPTKTIAILVAQVAAGSPAEAAGLHVGDRLISIDGETPFTASHALALLADKTEAVFVVAGSDGTERTLSAARKGIFGVGFEGEEALPASIKAAGPATTVLVTHRDYRPFTETLTPTERNTSPSNMLNLTLGGTSLALGFAFALIGGVLKVALSPASSSGSSATAQQTFNPGDVLLPVGLGVGSVGGVLLAIGSAKTYAPQHSVSGAKLTEAALRDAEGYNRVTGLDRFGVSKDGVYPDGSRFEGKLVQGKREGYGILIVPDGKAGLAGTFKADELSGLAMELDLSDPSSQRVTYLGYYEKTRRNGAGIVFDADRRPAYAVVYEKGMEKSSRPYPRQPLKAGADLLFLGTPFAGELAEGTGLATTLTGDRMQEGRFRAGELVEGTLREADGTVLKGRFEGGVLVQGSLRRSDGSGGEGLWKAGRLQSPGTVYFADGRIYSGPFGADGLPEGEGSMAYPNGDLYAGTFVRGVPQGTGTYSFKSGTVYTGDIAGGTFQGRGKQVKPNGETYDGEFMAGLPHGMGIYKFGDMVERAEYYEGKRIDQAFIIREEREKDRIERARLAELEEQRRRDEEARRIAEAQRAAEAQRRQAEAERNSQRNKNLFGAFMGTATGVAGMGAGMDIAEAAAVGLSMYSDVVNDRTDGSMTKQTVNEIIANRQAGASAEAKSRGSTSSFNERPAATPGSGGAAGGGSASSVKSSTYQPESAGSRTNLTPGANESSDVYPDSILNEGKWSNWGNMGQNTFASSRRRWRGNSRAVGKAEFEIEMVYQTFPNIQTDWNTNTSWKTIREISAVIVQGASNGPVVHTVPTFRYIDGDKHGYRFTTTADIRNMLVFKITSSREVGKDVLPQGTKEDGPVKVMRD